MRALTKRYPGGLLANDRLDLDVGAGEVFGLLGPNGAGKTTLVRQIIGLLRPNAGSIRLGGADLVARPDVARERCAYLPQGALPVSSFGLQEMVELVGRIRGGDARAVRRRADHLITALELGEWRNTPGIRLSGGTRRLAGFLMTAVWPVALVILDEPGLASVSTYQELGPAFERLLRQSNGELSVFYERCRALAHLPFGERHTQLRLLMAPSS